MSDRKSAIALIIIIATFTVIRLIISARVGLGVDEAHYALYGKFLALSYLDHPPLVGWIEAIFIRMFGLSEIPVRLPSIILYALDSWLIYKFTGKLTMNNAYRLLSVVAVNSSFLLFVLSFMFLPDSILLPISVCVILVVIDMLENKNIQNYLILGVLLGLAGLSKYTAVLFIPPLLIFAAMKKRMDLVLTPMVLVTVLIGLIFITPVIYWNYTHNFISFKYQFGHVIKHGIHWLDFWRSMAFQFGAYSPFYFVLAIYGLIKSLKSKNDYAILAGLLGGFILLFFVYASLTSTTLPHWDSVFYFLMIPTGTVYALESKKLKTFAKFSIGFTVTAFLFASSVLAFQYIRFPNYKSPFRDLFGYAKIMKTANNILKSDKNPLKAIAVEHWTFGSRTIFYNLKEGYKSQVYVIQNKLDQFKLWEKKNIHQLRGYDLLFILFSYENKPLKQYVRCKAYKPVSHLNIIKNKCILYSVEFEWCYGFKGLK